MSTASDKVPPELVARFRAALERLNPEGGRIGLAVSGGPDSMAMLLLAHAAIPGGFEVATVDHGLRPEAKDECALVVAACEARGVPCEVLTVEVGGGNVQAKAREARYAALGLWAARRGLKAIATAHHADDQAETLLMRLNRGSGLSGLAGVRELANLRWGRIIRPLLDFRRTDLASIVEGTGVAVAQDPSNADDSYDRVRIRKALAEAEWLDPLALARSAALLSQAEEYLGGVINEVWQRCTTGSGKLCRYTPGNSEYENIEMVRYILGDMDAVASRSEVATAVTRLYEGQNASLAGVLASVENGDWIFRPEPPRRTG